MGVVYNDGVSLNTAGAPSLNMSDSQGQQGALRNPESYASSARYTKQRMVAVLISAPPLMKYLPDYDRRVATLRSLMEDRATNITGVDTSVEWTYEDTVEGHSGRQRKTVTDAKITVSEPEYEWPELHNRSISNYWKQHGEWLVMDPELGHPRVVTLENYQNDANALEITEATQGFTMMFYEPTRELNGVVDAVLMTGMMPLTAGERPMVRAVSESLEMPLTSIAFAGTDDPSEAALRMAQEHLANINKLGLNPNTLPTYADKVSADVARAQTGFTRLPNNNG